MAGAIQRLAGSRNPFDYAWPEKSGGHRYIRTTAGSIGLAAGERDAGLIADLRTVQGQAVVVPPAINIRIADCLEGLVRQHVVESAQRSLSTWPFHHRANGSRARSRFLGVPRGCAYDALVMLFGVRLAGRHIPQAAVSL